MAMERLGEDVAGHADALWGLLCPDVGIEDWEKMIRWLGRHPDVWLLLQSITWNLPVVENLTDFEEVMVTLAAGTIRQIQRAGSPKEEEAYLTWSAKWDPTGVPMNKAAERIVELRAADSVDRHRNPANSLTKEKTP